MWRGWQVQQPRVVQPGEQIGDTYVVERFLAGGGMGQVYVARDTRLDRRVAVKLLHADRTSAEAEGRFQREARTLSQVVHPNVVGIHSFGRYGSAWYLAMEYVEGHSLHEQLKNDGPMGIEEVISVTRQVASGLAEAHEFGIIHRDIKPGNILLRRVASGALVAKVVDFGLARNFGDEGSSDVTVGTGVLGTPAYMSPEQIQGQGLDGRSDLYSLAVVVYQMLTGRLPIYRDTVQGMLIAHLVDKVPPIETTGVGEHISPGFQHELLRGLAKSPDERPATVAEFAEALGQAAGLRQEAAPGGVVECPACGHPSAEGGRYCSHCGSAVPLAVCLTCNAIRAGERYFCSDCGTTLLSAARRLREGSADEPGGSEPSSSLDRVTAAAMVVRLGEATGDSVLFSDFPQTFAAIGEREGGRPGAFLGRECIALFGLGGMREREISAAADAALGIAAAAKGIVLDGGLRPEVRVGIDLGLLGTRGVGVAWGTAFAGGEAVEQARHALDLVGPGEVGMGRSALREVRGLYETRAITDTLAVVERRRDQARSFADYKVRGIDVPLIGRDPELALLMRAARRVQRRGQLAAAPVVGPAGAGKSRLVAEFLGRLEDLGQKWQVEIAGCSPVGMPQPYEPFVDILRSRLATREEPDLLSKLAALPGISGDGISAEQSERRARSLARIMGTRLEEGEDDTLRPATEDEKKSALEAYVAFLSAAARIEPVLIVIEDLQWAREPTLELLDAIVKGCDTAQTLLVLPMRPERADDILGASSLPRARTTTLDVPALDTDESAELIEELLGGLQLPMGMIEGVHAFADGVPARVEEAVDALIEDRVLISAAGGWHFDEKRAAEKASLDASLGDMVLRRIGRLPPAERSLLQAIAVAGNFAPHGMVCHMLDRDVSDAELDVAIEAGFLLEANSRHFMGEREFSFRQKTMAETIAQALAASARAEQHQRAARWLQDWSGPRPPGFGGMLAHHLLVAGDNENAAQYVLRTARDAMRAFANRDAFDAFGVLVEVGRDLLEQTPDSSEGWQHLLAGLVGRGEVALRIGELEKAIEVAEEAAAAGKERGEPDARARSLIVHGDALGQLGRYEEARVVLDEATRAASESQNTAGKAIFATGLLAMMAVRQQRYDVAESVAEDALQRATPGSEDIGELAGLGRLHLVMGHALSRRGKVEDAMGHYEQSTTCFAAIGDDIGSAMTELSMGNLAYRREALDEAAQIYRRVADRCETIDYHFGRTLANTNLGNVLYDQGKLEDALRRLRLAEQELRRLRTLDYLPETLRLIAQCLVGKGDAHGARVAASEAAELARTFGNEAWEQASVEVLKRAETLDESMSATTIAEGFTDLSRSSELGSLGDKRD